MYYYLLFESVYSVSLKVPNYCTVYTSQEAKCQMKPGVHSPKGISHKRRGLGRDWEGAEQLQNQLAAFALVTYKHWPPTHSLVHRVHAKPPIFKDATRTLFSVHSTISTFSIEQGLRPPGNISSSYALGLYTYGLWESSSCRMNPVAEAQHVHVVFAETAPFVSQTQAECNLPQRENKD